MIFSLGGFKGGTAKSTIAVNLAVWLAARGQDVLMVDADRDAESTSYFAQKRAQTLQTAIGYTTVQLSGVNLASEVFRLRPKFGHIIIDVGAHDTTSQRSAWMASDVLLVPVQPSAFDYWSVLKVEEMVKNLCTEQSTNIQAFTCLSRAFHTGKENQECAEALGQFELLRYLNAPIRNRVPVQRAAGMGLGISEWKPKDDKAMAEFEALFSLLLEKEAPHEQV